MQPVPYYKILRKHSIAMIKEVLENIEKNGLHEENSIIFCCTTFHPDIILPPSIIKKYPSNISFILDNQFYELKCEETSFSTILNFPKEKNFKVVIPYESLLSFEDDKQKFIIPLPITDDVKKQLEEKQGDKF